MSNLYDAYAEILTNTLEELHTEYQEERAKHSDKAYIDESYAAAVKKISRDYTNFVAGLPIDSNLTGGLAHQKMLYELIRKSYTGEQFDQLKECADIVFGLFATENDRKNLQLEEMAVDPWSQMVHLMYLLKAYNAIAFGMDMKTLPKLAFI